MTHLVFRVEDGEVSDGENDFMQQFLTRHFVAVPQQVRGDVTKLQRDALPSERVLQETAHTHLADCQSTDWRGLARQY